MNSGPAPSPGPAPRDENGKPYVVVTAPPRFPDVLAEITRAQPLTMLSIAFITGIVLAAGWRR
jgi:hypothetical protein